MSQPMSPVTITIRPNGPYVVQGPVEVFAADGTRLDPPPTKNPDTVKLCACGASATKPFCDGSHKRIELLPDAKPGENPA